jgi:hypothetical protein
MKKMSKYFAVSELFPIFALAILEKTGGNALFDILHDRLTSFDLAKSGKFTSGVKTSLVKLVLYLLQRARTAYYICDTGYSRTLLGRCREVGRVFFLLCP